MAALALVTSGVHASTSFGSHIARWGDALVFFHRTSIANHDTTLGDTGSAGTYTGPTSIPGTVPGDAVYARAAEGDDTYLYMCRENADLVRVDLSGTVTDIGNRTTAGLWVAASGRHPSKVVTFTDGSTSNRITLYDRPGGGAGSDIVVSASNILTGTIAVDPTSGDVFVGTFVSGTSRGVRRYDDTGTLIYDVDIPNAAVDSVRTVNGLARVGSSLVAYTTDVDEPGGIRVNNNFWLLDEAGNVELLDVTVNGVDFGTWADTGTNEVATTIGSLVVVGNTIHVQASDGGSPVVLSGTLGSPWSVGRVAWGSRGAWH